MTVARVTQEVVESVSQVSPNARVSQIVIEGICSNALKAHITQVAVEMVSENVADDAGNGNGPSMIIIAT